MAGVATHSVVESTVRHAVDMGYEVTVAADACASAQQQRCEACLANGVQALSRIALDLLS